MATTLYRERNGHLAPTFDNGSLFWARVCFSWPGGKLGGFQKAIVTPLGQRTCWPKRRRRPPRAQVWARKRMKNSIEIYVHGHGSLEENMRILVLKTLSYGGGGGGGLLKIKNISLKFVVDSFQLDVIILNLKNMDQQKSKSLELAVFLCVFTLLPYVSWNFILNMGGRQWKGKRAIWCSMAISLPNNNALYPYWKD